MPGVRVVATVAGGGPDDLFPHIERFEDYPAIAHSVQATSVERDGDVATSRWEVIFRNGILKWTELDRIDAANHRIEFEQTEGDLSLFVGEWVVSAADGGSRIVFTAEFDLGMPTLASMLDPVAQRTLASNVRELIEAFARAAGAEEPSFVEEDAGTPVIGAA